MKAMISAMENSYGNPSSIHQIGMAAKDALQTAREQIARCLGCMPKEIFFTSGGTESDNQAIVSAAMLGAKKNKRHIISTAFEHHAVLHTLRRLKEQGFEIQLLDVGAEGNITAAQVEEAIRPDTCLVTVMFANNEIYVRKEITYQYSVSSHLPGYVLLPALHLCEKAPREHDRLLQFPL